MSEQARLVMDDCEQPLREAGVFVAVTFLIAAGVYLPPLARDLGWISVTLPPRAGLNVVGLLSPAIAALLVRLYDDGMDGVRSALGGLTDWRFGPVWWGVTLGLPVAFAAGWPGVSSGSGRTSLPSRFASSPRLGVDSFS